MAQHAKTTNTALRTARLNQHWSQEKVAELLGTTVANVSRWERGVTSPGLYFCARLCDLFQLPATALGLQDNAASAPCEPIWRVPYHRNPLFTGRDDILTRLHNQFQTLPPMPMIALCGLGGVGKTQVALEFAYRSRHVYQAIFWVGADTEADIRAGLIALSDALALVKGSAPQEEEALHDVTRWFQLHPNWLLILDNVTAIALVHQYIPTGGQGHILMTTQAQATGALIHPIALAPLTDTDGATFLLRRAKRDASAEHEEYPDALLLAQDVQGLPLALDQAGAYIEETGCRLADYRERLQTSSLSLLARRGNEAKSHPESVTTTLLLVYANVMEHHPWAIALLSLCTFLMPDAIPEEILEAALALLNGTGDLNLLKDTALAVLRRYSLISRHPETRTLSLHRLVQVVLRAQMTQEQQMLWGTLTLRAITNVFPAEGDRVEHWPRCERLLPHILTWASVADALSLAVPEANECFREAAVYCMERGKYQQARFCVFQGRRALISYPRTPQRALQEAKLLKVWGEIETCQEDYQEAEAHLRQATVLWERCGDRSAVTNALLANDRAVVLSRVGRYEEAKHEYQQALTILSEHPQERQQTAHLLSNFAIIYARQAQYDAAQALLQQAQQIYEQDGPVGTPYHALCLQNRGKLAMRQGNTTEAYAYFQQALAMQMETVGEDHQDTLLTLQNMAELFTQQQQYIQAESIFRALLHAKERLWPPGHTSISRTVLAFGEMLKQAGRNDEATALQDRYHAQ